MLGTVMVALGVGVMDGLGVFDGVRVGLGVLLGVEREGDELGVALTCRVAVTSI